MEVYLFSRLVEAAKFIVENLVDALAEEAGYAEGEREGGVKLSGLERIHGLPGDAESFGEVALTPAALGAQHAKIVLHLTFPSGRQRPKPMNTAHIGKAIHISRCGTAPNMSRKPIVVQAISVAPVAQA